MYNENVKKYIYTYRAKISQTEEFKNKCREYAKKNYDKIKSENSEAYENKKRNAKFRYYKNKLNSLSEDEKVKYLEKITKKHDDIKTFLNM